MKLKTFKKEIEVYQASRSGANPLNILPHMDVDCEVVYER